MWRCAACRGQFTVLTGTVLERTRAPLRLWLAVAADVVAGPVATRELARRHATTPETARHLFARLTAAGVGVHGGEPDARAELARVLRLPPSDVARIVAAAPGRRTPPAGGPTADYR